MWIKDDTMALFLEEVESQVKQKSKNGNRVKSSLKKNYT